MAMLLKEKWPPSNLVVAQYTVVLNHMHRSEGKSICILYSGHLAIISGIDILCVVKCILH